LGRGAPSLDIEASLSRGNSQQRRKAAKWIRTHKEQEFDAALLSALQKEAQSPKTWETQYHMIMALGAIRSKNSLELLWSLPQKRLEYMPLVAAGDAVMSIEANARVFEAARKLNSLPFIVGVIRAVAQPELGASLAPEAVQIASRSREADLVYWGLAASQKDKKVDASLLIESAKTSKENYLTHAADKIAAGVPLDVSRL